MVQRRVTVACACMYAKEGGRRAMIYAASLPILVLCKEKLSRTRQNFNQLLKNISNRQYGWRRCM